MMASGWLAIWRDRKAKSGDRWKTLQNSSIKTPKAQTWHFVVDVFYWKTTVLETSRDSWRSGSSELTRQMFIFRKFLETADRLPFC
jgi:hypothetical protein